MPDATTDWLVEKIIEYAKDEKHKYAIALEGAWGSGKTTFLKTRVASALEEQDKRLICVSLFGLKNSVELYDKLGAELIHLGSEGGGKGKTTIRTIAAQIPGVFSSVTSAARVPLNLNLSMKTAVDFLVSEKHVIVFDDVERRSEHCDDESLFGAINDLVENKKAKVILVSNSFKDDNTFRRKFDKDIREKLVWRIYPYDPSPSELVKSIFGDLVSIEGEIDAFECVSQAAELADCKNARFMLRAEDFIREICAIDALTDETIFLSSRKAALIEAVQFALLECAGKLSGELPKWTGDVATLEFVEYQKETERREKYSDFPCIKAYLNPQSNVGSLDLDEAYRGYINKRYPGSSSATELRGITSRLSDISELGDVEVRSLIDRFAPAIRKAEFSSVLIKDIVFWNCRLSDMGFEGLLSKQELEECCKKAIDDDPSSALNFFRHDAFKFSTGLEDVDGFLQLLADYAELNCPDRALDFRVAQISQAEPEGGGVLANYLYEMWDKGDKSFLDFQPNFIVDTFLRSEPCGQLKIERFFKKVAFYEPQLAQDCDFSNWLIGIRNSLKSVEDCELTTKMRIKWFIQNLNELTHDCSDEKEISN